MHRPLIAAAAALIASAPLSAMACLHAMRTHEVVRPQWLETVHVVGSIMLSILFVLGLWGIASQGLLAHFGHESKRARRLIGRDICLTIAATALPAFAHLQSLFPNVPEVEPLSVRALLYGVPALIGAIALRQHLKLDGWPREKVRAMRWISALVVCIAVTSFGFLVKSQTHFEPIEQASFDVDFGEVTF